MDDMEVGAVQQSLHRALVEMQRVNRYLASSSEVNSETRDLAGEVHRKVYNLQKRFDEGKWSK